MKELPKNSEDTQEYGIYKICVQNAHTPIKNFKPLMYCFSFSFSSSYIKTSFYDKTCVYVQ